MQSRDFRIWIHIQPCRCTPNYDGTSPNPQNITSEFVSGTTARSEFEWNPSGFWNHITWVYEAGVRVECLMRIAITLKQSTFYKHVCSSKILTGGTLMGVWTCRKLPALTSTLFVKTNRQTWLAFLDIALKQGIVSACISITHAIAIHAWFKVFLFPGFWILVVVFCLFGIFSSFFVTDGSEPAPAHHSFLIWPSDEIHNWGKLGSTRIQMLNSRINFSSEASGSQILSPGFPGSLV